MDTRKNEEPINHLLQPPKKTDQETEYKYQLYMHDGILF